MGGGYGWGGRFEWTLRVAGAGATEGERGLGGRKRQELLIVLSDVLPPKTTMPA